MYISKKIKKLIIYRLFFFIIIIDLLKILYNFEVFLNNKYIYINNI